MARGPKRHLKRLFAPKDWMLSKLAGVFAPRPRAGPHKLRECIPLAVILRNRLKYALNARESQMILRQKLVNVDSRARLDPKYPAGFQDVVEIPKTNERFRLLYDQKGRFTLVNIGEAEAGIKLCRVQNVSTTTGRVPVVTTHDGRRIRYPSLKLTRGDTVVVDHRSGKITDSIPLRKDAVVMLVGGSNRGRIGKATGLERHPGGFGIAHVQDDAGNTFATRISNLFVIGRNADAIPITLPKAKGVKLNPTQERIERLQAAEIRKSQKGGGKKRAKRA
jgi:small subunit ribosomal protein S4e